MMMPSLNPIGQPLAEPGFSTQSALQLGWRVAVLPFRCADSPLGQGIALGMAEEISAMLSRFRAPHLIAPVTFWDGTGPVSSWGEQCKAYRLDYVVDGFIQVSGSRVQVTVTLRDVVLDFEVIWVGRFEGPLDDLFSLQDRIASGTVAQIDPELFHRTSAFVAAGGGDSASICADRHSGHLPAGPERFSLCAGSAGPGDPLGSQLRSRPRVAGLLEHHGNRPRMGRELEGCGRTGRGVGGASDAA